MLCITKQEFRKATILYKRERKIRYLDGTSKYREGHGKNLGRHVEEMVQCSLLPN